MSTIQLAEAITDGGIHLTNFFNGRLLTAEDLYTEQYANRQQHQQLGQAIGDGIVSGLQVQVTSSTTPASGTPTTQLSVSAGLALNRKGQVLSLPAATDIVLVATAQQKIADAGLFAMCEPPQTMPTATGTGAYMLVLSPASGFEGRAPMSGLSVQGVSGPACGSKYAVEGVKFGLVSLDVNNLPGISDSTRTLHDQLMSQNDAASLSKLRNLLAHLCFGTEDRAALLSNLLSQTNGSLPADLGVLATLRSLGKLTDCDVPLALLYWTMSGIQFVDMASVRRRPVLGPPSQAWPLTLGGGYPAIGEAMSVQFQEHLASLSMVQGQPTSIRAVDYFRYLPSSGIIPFANMRFASGFDYLQFFQGVTYRDPIYIEGAKVEHIIRNSLSYRPVDLNSKEMFWLYLVRENMQAIAESTLNPPQAYMLFASGHIPYQGDARFDLTHWEYSNYSSVTDR